MKLSNVLRYNQVKLVLVVFASTWPTLNHIKQAQFNQ